jgi:Uma2 family endonuclease
MTTVIEAEKIIVPPLTRKKFCADEVYKMMEAGILPEESGWELINGEIIHRMPIGSKHASIVRILEKYFERNFGDRLIVSGQNPVHLDEHNEPEPDIALLKPRDDFYAENHPIPTDVLLVIEVSDSTIEYDREIKKKLYAEAGIVEFWLVNLKQNTIETYTNPSNGIYYQMQIFERDQEIQSKNIPDLTLAVSEILREEIAKNNTED